MRLCANDAEAIVGGNTFKNCFDSDCLNSTRD